MDRALGDALYILTNGTQIIPRKMRLTIATSHMQAALGQGPSLVLLSFIGPLEGTQIINNEFERK